MKCSDGCVVETRCRFQDAWPASNQPGLSPTRRSGLGADVDMSGVGIALPAMLIMELDLAHAPRTTSAESATKSAEYRSSDSRFTRRLPNEWSRAGRRSQSRDLTGR